jgi:hypothetical protein
MLMQAGLEEVRRRGGKRILLQVDEGNDAALRLYKAFAFSEFARRSTWAHRTGSGPLKNESSDWRVRLRQDGDWKAEYGLLQETAGTGLAWNVPLAMKRIRPSITREIGLFLGEESERHWLAWDGSRCQGVAISRAGAHDEQVLLFCREDKTWTAASLLLQQLRSEAIGWRALTVEADGRIPTEVFDALGFRLQRALIWFELNL